MRIRRIFYEVFTLIALAGLTGCSSPNSNSPVLDSSGKHADSWIVDHRPSFVGNPSRCLGCHGSDLLGGISQVSCFSPDFNGQSCHASGPAIDASGKHPANWIVDHRPAFVSNRNLCYECHGSDLLGGISQVSCFNAEFNGQSCHTNGPAGHPAGWRDPALHGADAKSQPGDESGFASCQKCHGADFSGGATGVSCFTAGRDTGSCHATNGVASGSPHAPAPWRNYPAPTHTDTVDDADGINAAVCALCHTGGANLRTPIITAYNTGKAGCFNSTLCHGQMGHPAGWADPSNHGQAAKSNLTYCQQCHSDNPFGGPGSNPRFNVQLGRLADGANTGCEVCHAPLAAHPRVIQIPVSFGTITTLNPLGTPWYLHCKSSPSGFDACNRCHGANLDGAGGVTGATGCSFCHRSGLPTTLKNCTSCHVSPPSGAVYPNKASAHPKHSTLNVADVCGQCHNGLGSVTLDHFLRAKNHTTSLQAGAIVFGAFAQTGGVSPAFNESNLQCTNTYCHGATLSGGANKAPIWSDGNYLTPAGCGTCHGFPPPNAAHTGFTPSTVCKNCHTHVNATNTGFDDPTKHINGAIDVAGGVPHAFPNPGSVHASTAGTAPFSGCVISGCHTNNVANKGAYPVASGTPPDCQACHTKAAPGNSCGSCHGIASTNNVTAGRPNGAAGTPFPDIRGHHNSPSEHASEPCTTCHGSNGTGQTTHGPSNRTAHTSANVIVVITQWNATARTCSTFSCHGHTHDNQNVW